MEKEKVLAAKLQWQEKLERQAKQNLLWILILWLGGFFTGVAVVFCAFLLLKTLG